MRHTVAVVAALSLPLLSGCAGLGVTNSSSSTSSSSPASSAESSSSTAAASSSSPSSLTKKFGSTFTWDDGVSLTVSKPAEFTSSATAFPARADGYVFDVTLKNGSEEPLNPMLVSLQAVSGEQQAEAIFDNEQGVDLPSASVLPGRSLKYRAAFTKPGGDFTLQVDYGLGNALGFYE